MIITKEMALWVGDILQVTFDKFPFNDFLVGLNIELEHGLISPKTNVTDNNLIMTAKIALAHLNESPLYYDDKIGLPNMERNLNIS